MKVVITLMMSGLAVSIALMSCSSPGVKVLESPIASTPLLKTLINPHKLTPEAELYLKKNHLRREYEKNPEKAILALRQQAESRRNLEDRCVVAELCYDMGLRHQKKNPDKALGYFLASAEEAYPKLSQTPTDDVHRRLVAIYNLSTGNIAKSMIESKVHKQHPKHQVVKGPWQTYQCQWDTRGVVKRSPAEFDTINLASHMKISGIEDDQRHVIHGIGAAMVAHQDQTEGREKKDPFLSLAGRAMPVTAVSIFSNGGRNVKLSLYDMLKTQSANHHGRKVALSADYSAPLVSLFNYNSVNFLGFKRLLHPEEYMYTCQLDEVTPFDPDKIPLIFVHGLASSPATWLQAINTVLGDPVLRARYQILVYSYPTGFPISYNSSIFRDWLQRYHDQYDSPSYRSNLRQMVLVGHSMGCLLSSAQIRSSGNEMLDLYTTKPINEIEGFSPKEKETLRHVNMYEANQDIRRVIFMAGPHRGSGIASNPIGKLGTKLIRLPRKVATYSSQKKIDGLTDLGQQRIHHIPDSIIELRPNAPYLMSVLKEPLSPRVTYHSIIGRAHPNDMLVESSDTVVPYWSAKLDDAQSEKVVHAKHTQVTGNEESIKEMRRILLLHVGVK